MRGHLYDRIYGCLVGGLIGDAMGAKAEDLSYQEIERRFGTISEVPKHPGTDDSLLKHMLCKAIVRSGGYPDPEDLAEVWREELDPKRFYYPVVNAYYKVFVEGVAPRMAGRGNMVSNSSAMCIAPIGLINAGDPRHAAREAIWVTRLIHDGFPQDAAAAVAAAIAQAIVPGTSPENVADATLRYLVPHSEMVACLRDAIELARTTAKYEAFRAEFYATRLRPWPGLRPDQHTAIDPRETVPAAVGLFLLSRGDFEQTVVRCVNFGRDADTIATIGGALAGAFGGAQPIPPRWCQAVEAATPVDQHVLTAQLREVVKRRQREASERLTAVSEMLAE